MKREIFFSKCELKPATGLKEKSFVSFVKDIQIDNQEGGGEEVTTTAGP